MEADPYNVARELALRQLSVQARTRTELADVLRRKQVPGEVAESVLNRLEQVGLIDDSAFAQSWVRSRQQRKHLSKSALSRELRNKGVEAELVADAVAEVDPDDEYTAAYALAERKQRAMQALDTRIQRRRLAGALARRGFSGALVTRVLDELLNGANDLDPDVDESPWPS